MPWGDVWGSRPGKTVQRIADAFADGRELGSHKGMSYTERLANGLLVYNYRSRPIAMKADEQTIAQWVTDALEGWTGYAEVNAQYRDMKPRYRCAISDKAEMRHLKALGVEAEWQYGKRPFLICGVDAMNGVWRTLEEWAALPKWVEPAPEPKRPAPERFVNRTLPLFA